MIKITDQLSRTLVFQKTPKRIISLVPSQTELLVDLGLETSIVGVTKFCIHPSHLKNEKIIVGGTKDIKFKKIKLLKPDIILCNKEENTESIVDECSKVCPVHVSDITSIEDCLELINHYSNLFSAEKKAQSLKEDIQLRWANFNNYVEGNPTKRVAYFIWRNPWMVVGGNTYIDYMLRLNKFENVFMTSERYPEVTLQELGEKHPELVLLSSEPYPFKEKHIAEIKACLPNARVVLVDGEAFSWYGSRLLKAFPYFLELHL